MLVILDLLWKNVWDQLLNSTEQSCHPMHNPVKSSRECHMCVCVSGVRVKICLIYCTGPPQSQNLCHLLSNSGFWRQYRYIRVIVFSFVSKCLSPVCHNQVLGLETILLHKIDDPSQLRKTRSKTKSHILSIYRYLKVSDNDYCSCELSRVATAG